MTRSSSRLTFWDIPADIRSNFWEYPEREDSCWLWPGTFGGYGILALPNGQMLAAHRVAYILAFGTIPADIVVCHRCDTPACVRPDHLFLGSQTQNMEDMRSKGRARGGRPRRLRPAQWTTQPMPTRP